MIHFKDWKTEAQGIKEYFLAHKTTKWYSQDTNSQLLILSLCSFDKVLTVLYKLWNYKDVQDMEHSQITLNLLCPQKLREALLLMFLYLIF